MTDLPDVKLKAVLSFPANIVDGTGIDVTKTHGKYKIDLAFDDFAPPVGGITDASHQNALLWNDLTSAYSLVPISVIGTGGAVPEAPNDGVQYGRKSLNWTPIIGDAFNVKNYGAVGNGTANDTAAINAAITAAAVSGGTVFFPPGVYGVSSQITMRSCVYLKGSGCEVTFIKLLSSLATDLIRADSIWDIGLSNLTIDVGNLLVGLVGAVTFQDVTDIVIDNIEVIDIAVFGIVIQGAYRFRITNNLIYKYTPAATQNQAILVTASLPAGDGYICGNYCIGSGLDICASESTIGWNTIRDFKFGGGITTEVSSFCFSLLIVGNMVSHGVGLDANATVCLGIESWAPYTSIIGNHCISNAGNGIDVGGKHSIVSENHCTNNGQYGSSNIYAGISARYTSGSVNCNYTVVTNNTSIDTAGAGGTQHYGYMEQSASLTGIILSNNQFSDNKTGPSNILSSTTGPFYAPLASPVFTGDPKAPTPIIGDNDTSVATTAFVTIAVSTKAPLATISTSPPSGGVDGDVWYQVP